MVHSLETHTRAYLTVQELAEYWYISPRAVHRLIESGALRAVHLGPRSVRISTVDARECEEQMKLQTIPVAPPSAPANNPPVQAQKTATRDQRADDERQKSGNQLAAPTTGAASNSSRVSRSSAARRRNR
jgi:excisionase family DNA binding protein